VSSLEALSRRVRQCMARTHLHLLATSGAVPGGTALETPPPKPTFTLRVVGGPHAP